jgi:acyl-[acyl carrier protein]--UDP-N-acetylglucosamine O-acyltransferase
MFEVVLPAPELKQDASAPVVKKPRKVRAPKHDFKDGRGRVFAHKHVNGHGWVEDTAKVADTVYVGKLAAVFNNAVVENEVVIRDRAKVCGNAYVRDRVRVTKQAFVGGNALLYDDTVIKDEAIVNGGTICGNSVIKDKVIVREYPFIKGGTLDGHTQISGYVQFLNSTAQHTVCLRNNCVVLNTTLNGYITIKNTARVINSSLFMTAKHRAHDHDENGHLLISDDVMIVGCDHFHAFLHIKGHTKIVGGEIRLSPAWNSDTREYIRAETLTTAIFPNARIRNLEQFQTYNNADINARAGTAQAVLASMPAMRQPFDFAATTCRLVMSMGDNT